MMPNMRPNVAPIAIEGTNIPAGTLHPYDIITRPIRARVASNSELAIRHWASVLSPVRHQHVLMCSNLLAKVVYIPATFTFSKQYSHTSGHINSKKTIEVAYHGGYDCESHGFCYCMIC